MVDDLQRLGEHLGDPPVPVCTRAVRFSGPAPICAGKHQSPQEIGPAESPISDNWSTKEQDGDRVAGAQFSF